MVDLAFKRGLASLVGVQVNQITLLMEELSADADTNTRTIRVQYVITVPVNENQSGVNVGNLIKASIEAEAPSQLTSRIRAELEGFFATVVAISEPVVHVGGDSTTTLELPEPEEQNAAYSHAFTAHLFGIVALMTSVLL